MTTKNRSLEDLMHALFLEIPQANPMGQPWERCGTKGTYRRLAEKIRLHAMSMPFVEAVAQVYADWANPMPGPDASFLVVGRGIGRRLEKRLAVA